MTSRSQPHQISVTGALYARIQQEATRRGLRMGDVIDAAIDGKWPEVNPRVAALVAATPIEMRDRFVVEASPGMHELLGDHIVRHGGDASRLFEAAVIAAIEASEREPRRQR